MTDTVTLKPCPFCGGEAKFVDYPGVCDVPFGLVVHHSGDCFFDMSLCTDAKQIERWNTRSSSTASSVGADGLAAHFTRMMEAAANYLEPTTYIARHPHHGLNGPCKFTTEFPMPDDSHSDGAKADINGRRDQAFIRDMIYMLDGPEQRAALAASSHPASAVDTLQRLGQEVDETERAIDDGLVTRFRSALRFAASHSVISSADEHALLAALSTAQVDETERLREALRKIDKWCCPVLCTNCADNRETARAALAASSNPASAGDETLRNVLWQARDTIVQHHQWHAAQTDPDPEHGFIPADEYADSSLYERTMAAIGAVDKLLETGPRDLEALSATPAQEGDA